MKSRHKLFVKGVTGKKRRKVLTELSTIFDVEMAKNQVIHEVIHIINKNPHWAVEKKADKYVFFEQIFC